MGCCYTSFLVLICLAFGLVMGIFLADKYQINGLEDLGKRLMDLFRKTQSEAQKALNNNN